MVQIDYYFSLLSPFTYFAGDRLEAIAARRVAPIRYKPMDIMTVFSQTGGTPPKDRHPARVSYRLEELRRLAAFTGLPVNEAPKHFPTNAAPASLAVIAAQEAGFAVGPVSRAILRAVWAEERDIADADVVSAALEAGGVKESSLAPHLEAAQAIWEANTREAIEAGVFGAPTYVVAGERFWGQDRLPHLEAKLEALSGGAA